MILITTTLSQLGMVANRSKRIMFMMFYQAQRQLHHTTPLAPELSLGYIALCAQSSFLSSISASECSAGFGYRVAPLVIDRRSHGVMKRFIRGQDGKLRHDPTEMFPIIEPYYDGSSCGLYTYASEYIKVLISLTRNDGELHRRGRLKQQPDDNK
jgi:hypothetical protein